jgi:hypothetical protein
MPTLISVLYQLSIDYMHEEVWNNFEEKKKQELKVYFTWRVLDKLQLMLKHYLLTYQLFA